MLFKKSEIEKIEFIRKKVVKNILLFFMSIITIFILAILTIHDNLSNFFVDLLSCFK